MKIIKILTSSLTKKQKFKVFATVLLSIFIIFDVLFFVAVGVRYSKIGKIQKNPQNFLLDISHLEKIQLENKILEYRKEKIEPTGLLNTQKLPYKTTPAKLEINAGSAILIDCDTGDILFEKNPDELIAPASMTKIFLMYTVFKKIQSGKASLDDIVPLGPESYACNMPLRSSLMFLGKGQIVTLRELMTGLAVCSGNDASHAIAYYLFGSVEKFLEEVNRQIKLNGLSKTVIVEPSGYSEKNVTTAREMADFAKIYLAEFPQSLELFHSVKTFSYPKSHNISPLDKGKAPQNFKNGIPESIWSTIVQENTNKLLKSLDGCDGLKTGYIDESGYNLSLTCIRDGHRFLSVTMKGPGKNIFEGDKMRQDDGRTLQEFGFRVFGKIESRDIRKALEKENIDFVDFDEDVLNGENRNLENFSFALPILGAKSNVAKLIVPCSIETSVPKMFLNNEIFVKVEMPNFAFGKVNQGAEFGKIKIFVGDFLVREENLIFDRSVEQKNSLSKLVDSVVFMFLKDK